MATTVSFQDGVHPDAGYESTDGEMKSSTPDTGNGTKSTIEVGYTQTGTVIQRAVVEFDLSSIPTGAVVQKAQLTLYIGTAASGSLDWTILRGTEAFDETAGMPTWNNKNSLDTWAEAGGSPATALTLSDATYTMPVLSGRSTTVSITDLVDDAVRNRSGILRMIIKSDTEAGGTSDTFVFSSCDHGTAGRHPQVDVTYVPGKGTGRPGIHSTKQFSRFHAAKNKRHFRT
jgi:hypothetical protein